MRRNSMMRSLVVFLLAVLVTAFCRTPVARAAALWQGNASNDFNDSANWVVDDNQSVHTSPGGNDYLYLGSPAHLTDINVSSDVTVTTLGINWPGATLPVTISGHQIQMIGNPGSYTLQTLAGSGLLTFNSNLNVYSAADQTWDLRSDVVINGIISSTQNGSRLRDVIKVGSGALTLNGANTFGDASNDFNLKAGTVNFGNASALGGYEFALWGAGSFDNTSGSALTLNNNNILLYQPGTTTFVGTNDLNMGTGSVNVYQDSTLNVASHNLTLGGTLTNGHTLTKDGGGTLTLNAALSSYTGSMTVSAGTLALTGSNGAYTKTVTVNGGALQLGNASALSKGTVDVGSVTNGLTFANAGSIPVFTVGGLQGSGGITLSDGTNPVTLAIGNNDSSLTYSGVFTGGAGSGVNKVGSGTVTLSGNSNFGDATHGVSINEGRLNIGSAQALGASGNLLTIKNNTSFDNSTGSALALANNPLQNWTSNIAFVGSNDLDMGTGAVTLAANTTMTVTAHNLTIGGAISGNHDLNKQGTGTLTLNGVNTFGGSGGDLLLRQGTLNFGNARATGAGGIYLSYGAANVTTIDNSSGAALTLLNNNPLNIQSFNFTGSNDLDMGTGAVSLNDATVTVNNNTLTIGGNISNASGARSLVKQGAGTLVLSGNNSFGNASNGVELQAGTLKLGHAHALGADGNLLIIKGGTIDTNGADLTLTNNSVQTWGSSTISPTFTFAGTNNLDMGTGAVSMYDTTLIVNNNALTVGGIISNASGAKSLVKQGAGTLVLSGNNSFGNASNGIELQAGTLKLGHAHALGADGNLLIIKGGTIDTNGADLTLTNNSVQTWGSSTINPTFTFAGTNNLDMGTGAVSMYDATLIVNNNTLTVGGSISNASGARSLVKQGAGTLVLSGNNSFGNARNGVELDAGTLKLGHAHALGADGNLLIIKGGTIDNSYGGPLTLTNNSMQNWSDAFTFAGTNDLNMGTGAVSLTTPGTGVTLTVSASTLTVGGGISGVKDFAKSGAGTLILAGANTYSGDTYVNGGTLTLSNAGSSLLDVNDGGACSQFLGAGTLNLNGTMKLDVTDVTGTTGSWMLVDATNLSESYGGSFTVTMADGSPFAPQSGGVWTHVDGLKTWSFSESSGMLTVAVPEPGTLALLAAGLLGLLAYGWRKRK